MSSESEEDDGISVNTELIEFIDAKKDCIRDLISDRSFASVSFNRSERLIALHKYKSLRQFENNAEKETALLSLRMKEYIGSEFRPCEPYISHLFNRILTTKGRVTNRVLPSKRQFDL